jgi:hypothetical protein
MWDTIWEERLKGMEADAEMCTLDACTFVASFGGKEVLLNTSPSRCRYLAEEMKQPASSRNGRCLAPPISCRTSIL